MRKDGVATMRNRIRRPLDLKSSRVGAAPTYRAPAATALLVRTFGALRRLKDNGSEIVGEADGGCGTHPTKLEARQPAGVPLRGGGNSVRAETVVIASFEATRVWFVCFVCGTICFELCSLRAGQLGIVARWMV